jgi:hypothetical protein
MDMIRVTVYPLCFLSKKLKAEAEKAKARARQAQVRELASVTHAQPPCHSTL